MLTLCHMNFATQIISFSSLPVPLDLLCIMSYSENEDSFNSSFPIFMPAVIFLASLPWLLPPIQWIEVARVNVPLVPRIFWCFSFFPADPDFHLRIFFSVWRNFFSISYMYAGDEFSQCVCVWKYFYFNHVTEYFL